MLDFKYVRDHIDSVRERMALRGADIDWDYFLRSDAERRELLVEVENLRCQRNTVSEQIARLKREKQDGSHEIEQMKLVSQRIKELDALLQEKETAAREFMLIVPNIPHASVSPGKGSEDNQEVRRWGDPQQFGFAPQPHWDIGEKLGILDFDRGAKIAGVIRAAASAPSWPGPRHARKGAGLC